MSAGYTAIGLCHAGRIWLKRCMLLKQMPRRRVSVTHSGVKRGAFSGSAQAGSGHGQYRAGFIGHQLKTLGAAMALAGRMIAQMLQQPNQFGAGSGYTIGCTYAGLPRIFPYGAFCTI